MRKRLLCVLLIFGLGSLQKGYPQTDSPEEEIAESLKEKDAQEALDEDAIRDIVQDEIRDEFSRGIRMFEGTELRLGGKFELNFVDTQVERNSLLGGPTENPDPHLIFDRFRLEPEIDVGRNMEIHAQLDFLAEDGETFAKEAYFVYGDDPEWWLSLNAQAGLDDRFIHEGPKNRVTETYPLLATAFWRDEEFGFIFEGTLGAKRGKPLTKKERQARAEIYEDLPREAFTSSTERQPFDFGKNPGALNLFFSLADGYTLDGKEVTKDKADLQQIIQDDREVESGLSLRELGFGVGYSRDFNYLGELDLLGYYYEDELNDDSIDFLQQNLTLFDDLTGDVIEGYGLSDKSFKNRLGVRVGYHLESFHFLKNAIGTWPGDGLYVTYEYIKAKDGDLERDGWYAQVSYRFSFERPLLDDRYFRYIEPVFRYGELNSKIGLIPSLPLTWDRKAFLIGGVFSISDRVFVKGEYIINDENTGASGVDNNELLVQLLVFF